MVDYGYDERYLWCLTPRQLTARSLIADREVRKRRLLDELTVYRVSQADKKDVTKYVQNLLSDESGM